MQQKIPRFAFGVKWAALAATGLLESRAATRVAMSVKARYSKPAESALSAVPRIRRAHFDPLGQAGNLAH